jgi:hypothetical protein
LRTLSIYTGRQDWPGEIDMELFKAKQTLETLADGIDPSSGEVLPSESPYNDPLVIRALIIAVNSIRLPRLTVEQKQQDNLHHGRPRNFGLPWTGEMKEEAASCFEKGSSIDEVAEKLGRTKGAVVAELARQGLISDTGTDSFK